MSLAALRAGCVFGSAAAASVCLGACCQSQGPGLRPWGVRRTQVGSGGTGAPQGLLGLLRADPRRLLSGSFGARPLCLRWCCPAGAGRLEPIDFSRLRSSFESPFREPRIQRAGPHPRVSSLSHVSAFLCGGLGSKLGTLGISTCRGNATYPCGAGRSEPDIGLASLPLTFQVTSGPKFSAFFLSFKKINKQKNLPATALLPLFSNSWFCRRQFLVILRIFLIARNSGLCFPVRA